MAATQLGNFGILIPFILLAAQLFGQGYDIITDTSVAAEIMKFDIVNEEKFGFKIPGCAQISKVNQTQECQMKFKSHESYIQSRLKNLGLSFYLASTLAKIMEPKIEVGIRSKNDSSVTSTKTTETSLIEYRMAKISIGSFECDGIKFTDDFSSAVEKLPDRYINDDDPLENSNKAKFEQFFKHFGQHVVASAFVGGSVEVTVRSGSSETSEENEKSRGASAGINIPGVGGFEAGGKSQPSSNSAKNATTHVEKTVWHGGRSDLHSKSTLMSEEKLQMWKASLARDPILLTTEMRLMPISKAVAIIDEEKGDACYEALCDLFGIKDSGDVSDREERASQAENEKQEESRRDSNTRAGSVKAPELWFSLLDPFFTIFDQSLEAVFKLFGIEWMITPDWPDCIDVVELEVMNFDFISPTEQ